MTIRGMTTVLAAVAAIHSAQAAVDCSGKAIDWAVTYVPGSYKYDEAAQTTQFCYSVAYSSNFEAAPSECAPPGGQAQALTSFGVRFLSCFTDENGGLRGEMGTWSVASSTEGYAEVTMDGDNQFNGNLWTDSLPAPGASSNYCATFKRKLNLSAVPNTAVLTTDGNRFSIGEVQGPECYLEPTSSSVPPPPPTTTVPPPSPTTTVPPPPPTTTVPPPPPTTTVPPPPPTTTVPPPSTTTVPPTITPEPSVAFSSAVDTVEVLVAPTTSHVAASGLAAAPSGSASSPAVTSGSSGAVTAGAVAGASVGAGLLAAAAAAVIYARRRTVASEIQESQVDVTMPYAA